MASSMDTQPPRTSPGDQTPGPSRSPGVDQRIERLSTASLKRIMEPDTEVPGEIGDGQVLPDELLSLANVPELFDTLTDEQKRILAREEFASIVDTGVRFESVLMAGFSLEILSRPDLTDPRVTYLLHEMGEETRHSRLFVRLLEQVKPTAKNPLDNPVGRIAQQAVMPFLTGHAVALLPPRPQRRRGPRPPAEAGQRAPRHRPDDQGGLEVPPPGGGPPPRLRPHALPRAVGGRRPDRALPGPPPRLPHRHRACSTPSSTRASTAPSACPTWPTWKAVNRSAGRTAMRHRALRPAPHPAARGRRLPGRPRSQGLAACLRRRPPGRASTRWRRPDACRRRPPARRRAIARARPSSMPPIVRFAREGYRGTSVADVCRDAGTVHDGVVSLLRQQGGALRRRGRRRRGRADRRGRVARRHRRGPRRTGAAS